VNIGNKVRDITRCHRGLRFLCSQWNHAFGIGMVQCHRETMMDLRKTETVVGGSLRKSKLRRCS
jgi:hypothetical protein